MSRVGRKYKKINKINKSGFTLVELIVVLVILGILAAIMVPSLIGWIDKAKNQDAILECRSVVMAAQGQLSEEYSRGTELGTTMDGQLNGLSDEILKLAGVVGSGAIKTGSIVTKDSVVSQLTYENNGITVIYDREFTPIYRIDDGGYTGKTGKDHTQSLTDQLKNEGILKEGILQKDKLDEWLVKTNNKNNSNNNESRAVQEYFLEMTGGKSFPPINENERSKLTELLNNYTPPIAATDNTFNNLTWKPMITSNNEVILIAGTNNEKGNTQGSFIYYNGNYYGKLNYNGNGVTTIYVPDVGFDVNSLNDDYTKNGWTKLGN